MGHRMGEVPSLTKCAAAAAVGGGCLAGGGIAEGMNRCGVAGGVDFGVLPREEITSSIWLLRSWIRCSVMLTRLACTTCPGEYLVVVAA